MKKRRRGGAAASSNAPAAEEGAPAAGPSKKRRRKRAAEEPAEPSEDSDASEPSEQSDEEEGSQLSDVDVDFDFCDPGEEDYHSIGELLKGGTWEFAGLNFPELQDAVAGQGNIGSLVKSDMGGENEAICGMLTALNLRQFAHHQWPQALAKSLLAKAKKHASPEAAEGLQSIVGPKKVGHEVGLLLNERFANLPLELVSPLHKGLTDDIEWSCTTPECPEDERPFYRFTHFLGVARCHAAAPEGAAAASDQAPAPRGKRKRAKAQQGGGGQLAYLKPEDEAYVRKSMCSFSFPVAAPSGDKGVPGPPERRVAFLITRSAFEEVVSGLLSTLSAAA